MSYTVLGLLILLIFDAGVRTTSLAGDDSQNRGDSRPWILGFGFRFGGGFGQGKGRVRALGLPGGGDRRAGARAPRSARSARNKDRSDYGARAGSDLARASCRHRKVFRRSRACGDVRDPLNGKSHGHVVLSMFRPASASTHQLRVSASGLVNTCIRDEFSQLNLRPVTDRTRQCLRCACVTGRDFAPPSPPFFGSFVTFRRRSFSSCVGVARS